MKIDLTKITYGFFGACAVAGLTYLGFAKYYEKEISFGENYGEVIQAIDDIDNFYYQEPDKSLYNQNMIAGIVNGLNDRFSSCIDSNSEIEQTVNGSAQLSKAGFNIIRDSVSGCILINNVEQNSPAEKMGLCRGDLILSIDGVSVREVGYYNIIKSIVGKSNTTVEFLVDHNGEQRNVTYVREKDFDKVKSSSYDLLDNGIFYYRFDKFDSNTVFDFTAIMDSVKSQNDVGKLIIDLRKNHGGSTDSAVQFFDLFAPSGNQVVAQEANSGKTFSYKTTENIRYKDMKIVILVSNATYSSGEIIAALFEDTGLGTVVGTQTGGKGVFQVEKVFDNCYHYSLVAGYYYVNDIPNYNGVGIAPDIVVDMDKNLIGTDKDIQLEKAIELLS